MFSSFLEILVKNKEVLYEVMVHFAEAISLKGSFTEGTFRQKDILPKVHFIESISPNRPFR
uniref:Uncharacterized protein n=1 Tax=Rhizophagus irregularis (strain DAOM 181602 / DAOM 197198 / MUCL 43194) TaxID=747089 RepID=U9URQ7_RHIID